MEKKDIEDFRVGELLKASENIIEENIKGVGLIALAGLVANFVVYLFGQSPYLSLSISLAFSLVIGFLEILVIRNIKTDFEIIENRKNEGSFLRQILAYFAIVLVCTVVYILLIALVFFAIDLVVAIVGTKTIGTFISIIMLPLMSLLICIALFAVIILDCITLEVFIKNNISFGVVKDSINTIRHSKNGTLSKMILIQILYLIINTIFSIFIMFYGSNLVSGLILGVILAGINIFVAVYNYLAYMSNVEKVKNVEKV